ncbi:unnamed protein product [Macrosiphum euphorbiae]|uniref:Uncharacterized protein n=1 Tax=Macrosiphum euphorbiae TaxID=13131 RepID=A0AAV0YBP9_9HEMI|nr:unnamed protein product [Macrosiphum euphorbiae]
MFCALQSTRSISSYAVQTFCMRFVISITDVLILTIKSSGSTSSTIRSESGLFGSENLTGKLVRGFGAGRFDWFPPRSSPSVTMDASSLSDVPLINNLTIPSKCANNWYASTVAMSSRRRCVQQRWKYRHDAVAWSLTYTNVYPTDYYYYAAAAQTFGFAHTVNACVCVSVVRFSDTIDTAATAARVL